MTRPEDRGASLLWAGVLVGAILVGTAAVSAWPSAEEERLEVVSPPAQARSVQASPAEDGR